MAKALRERLAPARRAAWFLVAVLAQAAPTMAADVAASLADALVRDSETTLQFRSHYMGRDKPGPADSLAWAAGGWLGYRSGWAGDALRLGVTAYTSQKLHGPADKEGSFLLMDGQRSYSVLGEAYGSLKVDEQVFTTGRFLVDQYELNPQDSRMSPRTFQGAALAGNVGGVDYFIGRLDKMKARNWDYFDKVATVAGAPANITEPLLLISLRGTLNENLSLGFASYRVRDILASTYADAAWLTPISTDTRLRLGGQYMRQGSTGNKLLTGSAFSTGVIGVKTDLLHGPFTLSGIAMQTDRGAAYRAPFGSWPGYTTRTINSFNRAGERVWAVDAAVDFARLGAPGLTFNTSATTGRDAEDEE
ncbi:MAG: OprD family outer membrane porin, partial [Proteobacteria bacterium]|nr:OprD family outer membrane porin [Pseudomonadota bacterium]